MNDETKTKDQLIRELVEAQRLAGLGSWSFDPESGQPQWSEGMFHIWGLDPTLGPPHYSEHKRYIHPEDFPLFDAAVKEAIELGKPYELELRIIRPDGSERTIITICEPQCDASGKVVRLRGTNQDITKRKRTEDALRISERRLHEAQRVAHLGYLDWDIDKNSIEWSDETHRIFGFDPKSFTPSLEDTLKLIHPEDQDRVTSYLDETVRQGTTYDIQHRMIRPDGRIIHIHAQGVVIRDTQGKPLRMTGTIIDVTKRLQAEEALRATNELFSLFMRYSPIYTFIKEVSPTQSRVLQASENFREMVGIPGSEMIGKTMDELFPPEFAAKITADDWTVASEGKVLKIEETLGGKTYTTIKFPIKLGEKTLMAGYTIDITDRKMAEEERERLQVQLLQSQKMESVGRLAGGVAHDFNNMLGVILGHTELALTDMAPNEMLRADLEEIRKAANRSADLTRQLLAFARKQTVAPKVLNLNEAITGMLKMLKRLIGEDIDLNWHPAADLWQVKIDHSQVDQVLANLCVNARDALSGIGKITIQTENNAFDASFCNAHPPYLPGEFVQLSVHDNGCGIDASFMPHIFEPFFTTKGLGKGTGLGLATVYGIVQQNCGFIDVSSSPGHGACFRIFLPRFGGHDEQVKMEGASFQAQGGHETVLIVEDEPALLELIARTLEKLGYTVLKANSPADAVRMGREKSDGVHLLITDVIMPEMNGRDLAQHLQALHPGIKQLFMSGYPAEVIAHHGVLDDGVNFVQKPFSMKDLATKVRESLS